MLTKFTQASEKNKNLHGIEKSPILIEFEHTKESINKRIAYYKIHISFTSVKNAQQFFNIMENHLPLILKDNRVIIGTSNLIGVIALPPECNFPKFQAPFINFKDLDMAEQFYIFIKERGSWKSNTQISLVEGKEGENNKFIFFRELLKPNCSIENRKKTYEEAVHHSVFVILILIEFSRIFPNELALVIGIDIFKSLSRKNDSLCEIINLTNQFKLPKESFEQPYKKIDCEIKYSLCEDMVFNENPHYITTPLYKIHLVCSKEQDAIILKKNMDKALTELYVEIENNEVRINPIYFRRATEIPTPIKSINAVNGTIKLIFLDSSEAATFISFVNITSFNVDLCGNQLHFPELNPVSQANSGENNFAKNLVKKSLFFDSNEEIVKTSFSKSFPVDAKNRSCEISSGMFFQ
ncbi:MAG: hypothetical protein H0U70_09470 [Tatlockia sp.]|nr:hypothetical protein [Tatlockia sp.]